MKHVLVVDNDPLQCKIAQVSIEKLFDCQVTSVFGGQEAIDFLRADIGHSVDVVLLDLVMPEVDGLAVLREARILRPDLPVVIHTAHRHVGAAVQALSEGATDFVEKQEGEERLQAALRNAERILQLQHRVHALETAQDSHQLDHEIVGKSKAVREIRTLAKKAAHSDVAVCISGESGTGKTKVARAIHHASKRATKPFVAVSCAGATPEHLEAQLLGGRKPGRFELARGGVLCLEEVNTLTPDAQAVLLQLLQDPTTPYQCGHGDAFDLRVMATSSVVLRDLVEAGSLREDLYYMLNVFPLHVAPLRERGEDIAQLIDYFVAEISAKERKSIRGVERDVKRDLCAYDWPGNVRQLYNAVQRAVVVGQKNWLSWEDFSHVSQALTSWKQDALLAGDNGQDWCVVSLLDAHGQFQTMEAIESDVIRQALAFYGGNISRTAKALHIGRSTLYRKMTEYGITDSSQQEAG